MHKTYFENLLLTEAREDERRMVFAALRCRQEHRSPRGLIASLLWLLGVAR